jgi:hypothetical protein
LWQIQIEHAHIERQTLPGSTMTHCRVRADQKIVSSFTLLVEDRYRLRRGAVA